MSPADSARLIQWAQLPAPAAGPLSATLMIGLLLLFGGVGFMLWIVDWKIAPRPDTPFEDGLAGRPSTTDGRAGAPAQDDGAWSGPTELGAAQRRALAAARARRFLEVASESALSADPSRRRLASRAVFSAYRDCVELGLEAEARALLRTRSAPAAAGALDGEAGQD